MKARLQTAVDQLNAHLAGDAEALAQLQVTLGQALAEADEPPVVLPIDEQLAEIAAGVRALREGAGL